MLVIMKNLLKIAGTLCILLAMAACKREETRLQADFEPCSPLAVTVKRLADATGFILFNQAQQRYAIYVGIDGTYDAQLVGILCSIPESYRKDGLQVTFSGEYKPFDKEPEQRFPGQTYYYLSLSSIELTR